ncbi:glycosyltransferase family 2 protein [Rhodopirellula europaea]|uniref:glycosyltransferase family 2 protein n=1 Tax=Rhodopirellula europaea TaxID=1263866 RepID=UPI003D2D735A|tara:strand:- start:2447 stop:3229 length:783 start_codon:yes stop_codon:yes gene_type:complete
MIVKAEDQLAASSPPTLAVLVPVYNEANLIHRNLMSLEAAARLSGWDLELIVVDDGSSDASSAEIVRFLAEHGERSSFHRYQHDKNRGKGAAIRTGLQRVTASMVVCHDADLEYDPNDLIRLIRAMDRPGVDVVYGSRCLPMSDNPRRYNSFAFGVSALNVLTRLLYGIRLTDEATCYKMFRTADLRRMMLECEGFEFCPEVTAKACRLGLRILEVPISYRPRSVSEGKKIQLRDGWIAMKTLWRFRRWDVDRDSTTDES